LADELREIKTVCHCGRKAIMTVRFDGKGRPMRAGDQIQIGGNETYISMCRRHFKESLQGSAN
jgi:thymidine kinase